MKCSFCEGTMGEMVSKCGRFRACVFGPKAVLEMYVQTSSQLGGDDRPN
jgi:hypothetical protein